MSHSSHPRNSRQSGLEGEDDALSFLLKNGLRLLERNFSCRSGEIDLIMKEGETLVFVEVRKRNRNDFGDAMASITRAKQVKLIKTAQFYLQKLEKVPVCRFDALALDSEKVTWLKNIIEE